MTKVRDLISDAFLEAGVAGLGITLKPEDYNSGLKRLNWMLAEWRTKRWLVYQLVNKSFTANGAAAFTIGPTGDIVQDYRPEKVYSAFYRFVPGSGDFSNDYADDFELSETGIPVQDFPLDVIGARETYNRIKDKRAPGDPFYLYYEPANPDGACYLWPIPGVGQVAITIAVPVVLQDLSGLNTVITLPTIYEQALLYNLAVRLCVLYRKPVSPELKNLARSSLQAIRTANTQVPLLVMPGNLPIQVSSDHAR